MKTFLLTLFLITTLHPLLSQEKYSKVRLNIAPEELCKMSDYGIDLSEIHAFNNAYETIVQLDVIKQLKQANIDFDVLIDDMSLYYQNRNTSLKSASLIPLASQPEHWELGSMGGFYTLYEIMRELDEMKTLYPELVSERAPICDTLTQEGRPIYSLRISDNADSDEDEPEVLYTALHHAREPITVMQMIWFMWHLLENYDTNADVKNLVDNTEMYFIPVLNPDGYAYNQEINPNGGGMWRKNRRNNQNGSYGVDLNRNYGFKWGKDNWGSSPSPVEDTYRGLAAFSEPETKNVRYLCSLHDFRIVLNYHSYSDLLLYPWGYEMLSFAQDDFLYRQYAGMLTKENNYAYGPAGSVLFPVNGVSDDWFYAGQPDGKKTIAFTPEVGSYEDGFWPAMENIAKLCEENLHQNIYSAKLAGKHAIVSDLTPTLIDTEESYIKYSIEYLGLTPSDEIKVSLSRWEENGPSKTYHNVCRGDFLVDSIQIAPRDGLPLDSAYIDLLLTSDIDGIIQSQNIRKIYHINTQTESIPNDMSYWTTDKWTPTSKENPFSHSSLTISQQDTEMFDADSSQIVCDTIIDLSNARSAYLNFNAKWNIQPFSCVYIIAQNADSTNWDVLVSPKSDPVSIYNVDSIPAYRNISNWSFEEIDLKDYLGQKIRLGFQSIDRGLYNLESTFLFNNITISMLDETVETGMYSSQNLRCILYPNPVSSEITIRYLPPVSTIRLYTLNGQLIKLKHSINNEEKLDISDLNKGIYLIKISDTGKNQTFIRKVVVN